MILDREAALEAMKALVVAYEATPGTKYFRTVSRRLIDFTSVPPENQPACFIHDAGESTTRASELGPSKEVLKPEIILYTHCGPDDVPSSVMNVSIKAFLAAIAPAGRDLALWGQRQTLGGIVSHCYVDGETLKFPGDQDNQNVAILPVRILGP